MENKCTVCKKPASFSNAEGKARVWLCEKHWLKDFSQRFDAQNKQYEKAGKK